MNLYIDSKEYNIDNVQFLDPIKNTVMNDSSFIRIIYSNKLLTLNGIYISLKIDYNTSLNNTGVILFLENIERTILKKYNNKKTPVYKIKEQFNYIYNKYINNQHNSKIINTNNDHVIKISGIWETKSEYGITFKFVKFINKI